ncbi:tripartite tricarboxylate transporter TctB family protein [Actinobacillus porcinus]|uniref:tripartite tricarboxylate transporter TctB family protein n=1 Tax=Actinobacillus porcinus TaxID=51048 RepID=UPI0023541D5A|nr:tripartite tricarboxylate transporter TctB family protein [Actinobacillus porcinus]
MRSKRELWVCLIIILLASITIYLASQFKDLPPILQRGLQPSTFPIICATIIIILAIQIWLRSNINSTNEHEMSFNHIVLKMMLIFLGFIFLLYIDFFLAIALTTLAIHILWSKKARLSSVILLGVVLPIFIYLLFGILLDVKFPSGIINYLQ